jgi:hypothetical protein
MNFEDLKKIITNNERLVFMENDQPSFVVISFAEYQKMMEGKASCCKKSDSIGSCCKEEIKSEVNQGIQLPPHHSMMNTPEIENQPLVNPPKELRLEDLPF